MYNVRIIEYPTGYHVRLYDRCISGDAVTDMIDPMTGEILPDGERVEAEPDQEHEVDSERSLRVSMTRTKNNIYYIARSNIWEWFVTLTLDSRKIDRYDFKLISCKVQNWFRNLKSRKAFGLYYLIVPEQHKNGAWHFHGLLGGCDGLSFIDSGKRDKGGQLIYNFENWKFGFSTATMVQDTARVSSYISKYITKTLCQETKGLQRYWVSKNCQRAPIIDRLIDGSYDMGELRYELYENMTYKKRVETEYLTVEYYEIPKGLGV